MRDPALTRLYVATFLYSFAHALGVPLVPEHLSLSFGASLQFIGIVMGLNLLARWLGKLFSPKTGR